MKTTIFYTIYLLGHSIASNNQVTFHHWIRITVFINYTTLDY